MNFLLESIINVLIAETGLGTFLELKFSMSGKPEAVYTHGSIKFDNIEDLSEWWRPRHERLKMVQS